MDRHTNLEAVLDFLDNFIIDFSSLCGGLRLASRHLPSPTPSCQEERDALDLLDLMLIGLEKQEQVLADNLSAFVKPLEQKEER